MNVSHFKPQPDRLVLSFSSLEGWRAELTLVAAYILRWFICLQKTVTHASNNHVIVTQLGIELVTF